MGCTAKYIKCVRKKCRRKYRRRRDAVLDRLSMEYDSFDDMYWTFRNRWFPCSVCDGKGTVFAQFQHEGIWWSYSCPNCTMYEDDHWLGTPERVRSKVKHDE